MLYNTFSIFGDVERAVHIVDERGKPTGEGIVEFERKAAAQDALRNVEERVFMVSFLEYLLNKISNLDDCSFSSSLC